MEVFPSRASRTELPLNETADHLMQALINKRTSNTNTMLDWLDSRISIEDEDPPMLDMKYFAIYD